MMKTAGFNFMRFLFAIVALSFVLLTGAFQDVKPGNAQAAAAVGNKVFIALVSHRNPLLLKNGNFELGRVDWSETSIKNLVIIVDVTSSAYQSLRLPTHSGKWIAWLGGEKNENSAISQKVTINREMPYLTYWQYIASEDTCTTTKDVARILVNSNVFVSYDLCKSTQTSGWKQMFIDLTSFAGQDAVVGISVVTDGAENSNLFIDDVSFTSGPTSASFETLNLTGEQELTVDLSGLTKDQVVLP
jgi:hypothetical protein